MRTTDRERFVWFRNRYIAAWLVTDIGLAFLILGALDGSSPSLLIGVVITLVGVVVAVAVHFKGRNLQRPS